MADKPTAPWFAAKWSEEDGGNVGTCADYPSLSHLAPTPEKALAGIRRLVAAMESADRESAGRITLAHGSPRQANGLGAMMGHRVGLGGL